MAIRKLESLSCIVPALNEYENLAILLPRLQETLGERVKLKIILIDDGSTDQTPDLFEKFRDQMNLQYIQFSRNFGKEAAIAAGCQAVDTQAAVLLDADLQHPPALINDMIDNWEEGYDMVYTYRKTRNEESFLKKFGTKAFYSLFFSRKQQMPAHAGDFRLMDISVIQALNQLPERRRFTKGLYHWVGFSTKALPYVPEERQHGKSHFKFMNLLVLAIDGITSFSVRPLRLALVFGVLLSLFGFTYMTYIIFEWIFTDVLKGFTTIVVLMCSLFGMLFILLGVIGEYVGKIFEEAKQRPLFIVQQNLLSRNTKEQYQRYDPQHAIHVADATLYQNALGHAQPRTAAKDQHHDPKIASVKNSEAKASDGQTTEAAQPTTTPADNAGGSSDQPATKDTHKDTGKDAY